MSQRRTLAVARFVKSEIRTMGNFFKAGMPVGPRLKKWRAGDIGQRKYGKPR